MAKLFKEVKILGVTQLPDVRETSPCLKIKTQPPKSASFYQKKI
jgi:hypothetical protein